MRPDFKDTRHVAGTNQVIRGVQQGSIMLVYLAQDADEHIIRAVTQACAEHGVPVETVPSKIDLGKASGIPTAAAAVGLLKP